MLNKYWGGIKMKNNFKYIYKLSKRTRKIISEGIGVIANYNYFLKNIESRFKPSHLENWITEELRFMDPISVINFRRNLLCRGLINKPHEPKGFFIKYSQEKNATKRHQNFFSFTFIKSLLIELRVFLQSINPKYKKKVKSKFFCLLKEFDDLPNMKFVSYRVSKGDNNIGNPYRIYIKEKDCFITESFVRHSEYFLKIIKFVNLRKINKVLEIGSGYGGFIEVLINSLSNIEEVFLIDFPQRLNLAGYYLSESINKEWELKYFSKKQSKIDSGERKNKKLVNLVSIENSADLFYSCKNKIDLIINTHSLQEMSNEQISFYANNINLVKPNYFISINRDKLIKNKISRPNQILLDTLSGEYDYKSIIVDNFFTLTQFTKK